MMSSTSWLLRLLPREQSRSIPWSADRGRLTGVTPPVLADSAWPPRLTAEVPCFMSPPGQVPRQRTPSSNCKIRPDTTRRLTSSPLITSRCTLLPLLQPPRELRSSRCRPQRQHRLHCRLQLQPLLLLRHPRLRL